MEIAMARAMVKEAAIREREATLSTAGIGGVGGAGVGGNGGGGGGKSLKASRRLTKKR